MQTPSYAFGLIRWQLCLSKIEWTYTQTRQALPHKKIAGYKGEEAHMKYFQVLEDMYAYFARGEGNDVVLEKEKKCEKLVR